MMHVGVFFFRNHQPCALSNADWDSRALFILKRSSFLLQARAFERPEGNGNWKLEIANGSCNHHHPHQRCEKQALITPMNRLN